VYNKRGRIKERLPLVGIFLLLLFGIGLFMYPIVSDWICEYNSKEEINTYDQKITKTESKLLRQLEKEAKDYNTALAQKDTTKISVVKYDDLLAVTDAISYIEIPKIGVYLPIYHGLSDEVLQKGIGHMEGTSLPVGGEGTHCVLAGHTGLPSAEIFTDLDQMSKGDAFFIHILDKVLEYQVDQIKVVLPYEEEDIQIVKGKDYITLLTCTPYGINDHRLLVRGKRIVHDPEVAIDNTDYWPIVHESEKKLPLRTIVWYASTAVIGIVLTVILIILLYPTKKRKKKKKQKKSETSLSP